MTAVLNRRVSRLVGWMLAAAVVAAGGVAATPAQAEAAGSISGVVTDSAGAPASGVQVISHRHEIAQSQWVWGSSTQTGPDGSFTLTGLSDGEYRIEFDTSSAATSLASQWWEHGTDIWSATTVTVSGGVAVTGISPSLAPGATIAGAVTDEKGAAVRGVSVHAIDADTGTWVRISLTDASGGYRSSGLPAGNYIVEFDPLGDSGPVVGEWWDDSPSRSGAAVVAVAAGDERSGVDAVLARAGSITGVVTASTGAPAPNIYVSVSRATADGIGDGAGFTQTDATGSYTLGGLAAGDYKVQFSTTGPLLGEWFEDAADPASAARVSVVAGAATSADAELAVGASITGIVTDEAGRPVGNVSVGAHPITAFGLGSAQGTVTAADGTYTIRGLKPADYKVEFETSQATTAVAGEWWDDAKTADSATVLTLGVGQVASDISPRLSPGAEISGTVVDGTGAPLNNVRVTVHNGAGTPPPADTWTTTDGTFSVRGLDAGSYRLGFTQDIGESSHLSEWWNNAPDAASADDIVVSSGEKVGGIDATISEDDGSVLETNNAVLSGRVTDAQGAPIQGATVEVDGGNFGDGFETLADGTWSIGDWPAGRYTVQFSAEIDGKTVTQWWHGASDKASATVIDLANAEHRSGIDATLGAAALPTVTGSVPKITGVPRIGRTLKVHAGTWTKGTRLAYQWLADGVPIAGEVRSSLLVRPAYIGARITVAVTGSLTGYQSATETSRPTAAVPQPRPWERWVYRWLFKDPAHP